MQELQKLHRVIGKQLPGAPHEVLLVSGCDHGDERPQTGARVSQGSPASLDWSSPSWTAPERGDGPSAIQKELGLPIKFVGLGEQADDLAAFRPETVRRGVV